MMRSLILALAVLALTACGQRTVYLNADGTVNEQRAAEAYGVMKLFTVDGCTVYRFEYGYFTNCKGSVQWSERSGKTSHDVINPTGDGSQ